MMLRCCGAPAEWSGDEEKHQAEIQQIRTQWEDLGKPTLILACPTCIKKFKQDMSSIPVISLYEIIAEWGVEPFEPQIAGTTAEVFESDNWSSDSIKKAYSVFDACAARHEGSMKQAVRKLAEKAGVQLEPLPGNDSNARCCGYGGQPGIANPGFSEYVARKRISESGNTYITYCINCRDIFLEAGKETVHVLELLFGNDKREHPVTVSRRRENRIMLKKRLLQKFWGEEMENSMEPPKEKMKIKLNISSELSQKLSRERILEEDLADVVAFCERTGRRVWLPDKMVYSGYSEEGFMTYWVEYREVTPGETFELVNAYSHRMKIELEEVWNGRKTDAGL